MSYVPGLLMHGASFMSYESVFGKGSQWFTIFIYPFPTKNLIIKDKTAQMPISI